MKLQMAIMVQAYFFIFQSFFLSFARGDNLKIVFLTESIQKDFAKDVSAALFQLGTAVKDFVVVLNTENISSSNGLQTICSILSKEGISAVVDFIHEDWHDGIEFFETNHIPHVRVEPLISPILRVFSEFLQEKSANDVAMIFESQDHAHAALHHIVRGFPFRTIIVNDDEHETDYVKRLIQLRPSPSYFAVFGQTRKINLIFEKINQLKLFARPAEWHFIFLDGDDYKFKYKHLVEGSTKFNINSKKLCAALRMKDTFCGTELTYRKIVVLEILRGLLDVREKDSSLLQPIKAECNRFSTLNLKSVDLFSKWGRTKFLIFADNERENGFPRLTYTVNMSISSFRSDSDDNAAPLAISEFGKIRKINETISPAKRFFRIGTSEAIPWSYYKRDPITGKILSDLNGNAVWEGYCIDLIALLAERMNFDYEIIPPKNGRFGKRDIRSRQWDGLIGDLVSGETDFAVAALKMTAEREEVIDFIAPYFEQTGISIVMRKAVRQTSLFKFMTVLRLEVWLSIIAALVVTAIMLWLLDKYSPYSAKNNKEAYPYPCRDFTLKESFWFAMTSFTPQGGGEAPKAISGRILVAAYWLFVVLMLATFTANLAAFLTVERMQTPVQSLEQLARQSRINYTVVEASDTHQYFINMKFAEDTMYRLWKELALNATNEDQARYRVWDYPIKEQYGHILLAINSSMPVKNAAEGFRKVNAHENADFAFIHDSAEIKYEITKNCNLTEVGEVFAEQPYAIAVQQGSHLADEISYNLLKMQKDRLLEDLTAKYWNYSQNRECSRSENQEGITLESLGGVFIATLCGLGFAMITLAGEVIYYRRKQQASASKIKMIAVKEAPTNSEVEKSNQTPPPPFEVATRRLGNISERVTLGESNRFKPRKPLHSFTDNRRSGLPGFHYYE